MDHTPLWLSYLCNGFCRQVAPMRWKGIWTNFFSLTGYIPLLLSGDLMAAMWAQETAFLLQLVPRGVSIGACAIWTSRARRDEYLYSVYCQRTRSKRQFKYLKENGFYILVLPDLTSKTIWHLVMFWFQIIRENILCKYVSCSIWNMLVLKIRHFHLTCIL